MATLITNLLTHKSKHYVINTTLHIQDVLFMLNI